MTLIELPPQKAPRQLTAAIPTRSLEHHLLAFLAVNNPKGYVDDVPTNELTQLVFFLFYPLRFRVRSLSQLRKDAKRVKRFSERIIKHGRALEYMAKVMGYKNWNELLDYVGADEKVININYGKDPIDVAAKIATHNQ